MDILDRDYTGIGWAQHVRYNRGQEERMARVPLTKEEVAPTRLVLNVEKIGLTEDQFFQLCSDNRDLRMELTAQKELIVMAPTGLKSAWREIVLSTELMNWARKDGTISRQALFNPVGAMTISSFWAVS